MVLRHSVVLVLGYSYSVVLSNTQLEPYCRYAGVFNGVDLSGKDFGAVMETLGKRAAGLASCIFKKGIDLLSFYLKATPYIIKGNESDSF